MRQPAASMGLPIKVISIVVVSIDAGLLLAAFVYHPPLFIPGLLLGLIALGCWLRAPVAYGMENNRLTVVYRLGNKQFEGVQRISRLDQPIPMGIRVWGNGGLFAATGTFWNRQWGTFRAYLTRSKPRDMVLVQTEKQKILISPEKPADFVESFG